MLRVCARELSRQLARTILTVAGITIGIFSLTVLGAMAEHFRVLVDDAKGYVGGVIRVTTKTNKDGENPGVSRDDLAAIKKLPGVAGTSPSLVLLFDGYDLEEDPLLFLSPKPLVEGLDPALARSLRPSVRLVAGRWLEAFDDDRRRAMVARWLAEKRGLRVGGECTIRKNVYEIVGLFEAPDIAIVPAGIMPFSTLRADFERPSVRRAEQFLGALSGATGVDLGKAARKFIEEQEERYYPHEIAPRDATPLRVHELAEEIRRVVPSAAVIEPDKVAESMEKAIAVFLAITAVVSIVSSIVGGLLIVNTMAMAVIERRREIAIKVAVGASSGQVAAEFVVEAAILSLAGTALGLLLGLIGIAVLEPVIIARFEVGRALFRASPRLLLLITAYGSLLGVAAGLVPALRAARTEPAHGLREL